MYDRSIQSCYLSFNLISLSWIQFASLIVICPIIFQRVIELYFDDYFQLEVQLLVHELSSNLFSFYFVVPMHPSEMPSFFEYFHSQAFLFPFYDCSQQLLLNHNVFCTVIPIINELFTFVLNTFVLLGGMDLIRSASFLRPHLL